VGVVRAQHGPWHYQGVRNDEGAATTSAELRAHNLARLLRAVHEGAGQHTRAELTRQLGLARGTATVLVRELAGRQLIEERPGTAVVAVRGRPTGVPSPHPEGPVALAVDLREDAFTIAAFELTGRGTVLDRRTPGSVTDLAARLSKHRAAFGDRLVGVGVAVPSPVADGKMLLTDGLDISALLDTSYVGNDATLAGLAEARRGVLRGVPVALHLHVATGIGGVLLSGGKPVAGAHDAAGEFGHMPLTGGDEPCRCGASGCWELDAGARGLLRAAGLDQGDPAAIIASDAAAAARVATALGRGIGALVNAHDPETVALSGLAAGLLAAAPDAVHQAYLAALMRFRRARPPALLASSLGDLGTLTGAAELVFDGFLTARGLTVWAAAKTP
jgi:predicted NBD/HSP70 family sugar kinase